MSEIRTLEDWAKREHRAELRAAAATQHEQGTVMIVHPRIVIALLDALDAAEAGVRGLADYVQFDRRITALEAAEDARVRGVPRPRQGEGR